MKWELVQALCTKKSDGSCSSVGVTLRRGREVKESLVAGVTVYEAAVNAVIKGVTDNTPHHLSWLPDSYEEKATEQEGYKISLALVKPSCPCPFKGQGEANTLAEATVLACLDAINSMQLSA